MRVGPEPKHLSRADEVAGRRDEQDPIVFRDR